MSSLLTEVRTVRAEISQLRTSHAQTTAELKAAIATAQRSIESLEKDTLARLETLAQRLSRLENSAGREPVVVPRAASATPQNASQPTSRPELVLRAPTRANKGPVQVYCCQALAKRVQSLSGILRSELGSNSRIKIYDIEKAGNDVAGHVVIYAYGVSSRWVADGLSPLLHSFNDGTCA